MKGKVLSVRISEKDLASCVELCNSVHLKPIGMGGYLTKTLGILLENLRQSHKILNMSESQAKEVLKQTFGDREVGYSCELPDSFADFSLPKQFPGYEQEPKVPHFERPVVDTGNFPRGETYHTAVVQDNKPFTFEDFQPGDEEIKFDQDLEEEIRLSAMLEGESLIDKLLITEHRKDDKETKLMNPDLAGPVLTKKEGDDGES